MVVVDAAVILEVLLQTERALSIEARIFSPAETLHAPHLLVLEIVQVIRRYYASGEMTSARAYEALMDFRDFTIHRYTHDIFLPRIWELRHNLSAYDAAYVVLAETLSAPLLTCDTKLASAPGHTAAVELV